MPSTLLRLAVALLAFGLGVTATTFWIAYRTPDPRKLEAVVQHAHPLPPLPTIEEPPPPPPPPPPMSLMPRAPISGGILNGKAISKPAPAYPALARAAHASGTINVAVMVDEEGRVISAQAVSGHPLLQRAAMQAAYEARFAPTRLEGQPVKVTGTLSYNFVLQ
jgi:periplasmic protein TonB